MGKFMSIFFVNKNGDAFSCKNYLKIVQRMDIGESSEGQINVVAALFKENSDDYMIIDASGEIIGAGSIFMSVFGSNIIGIPLKFIC